MAKILVRLEVQRSGPLSKTLPIELQEDDEQEHSPAESRLGAKAANGPQPLRPLYLKVTDDEAARGSSEVDPCSYLTGSFRVRVQIVCAHCDGDDHDAKDIEPPSHGGDHEMIPMFEGEAE